MTEALHVVKDARGKRPQFHESPGVDKAMSMVMVLASELSALRDRLDSAERVAKASGLDLAVGIEALELDQQALEEREAWRQGFLDRLFYLARKEASEAATNDSADRYREAIEDIAVN